MDRKITVNKVINLIERWAVLLLVLSIYLFLSLKSILFLADPPKQECGMPFAGALAAQTILAFMALVFVSLKFYFTKNHSRLTIAVVYLLILFPTIVTYLLF